ncbi:MAG: hypothetical protein VXY45_14495, partial [Pseudomonadota bacterium]|nr:hypothetical protein [Pseudomonadota bacterium]
MAHLLRLLILCLMLPGLAPVAALAQQSDAPAVLVADRVWLEGQSRVIAEGAVEVMQGDVRLRAARVSYDRD